MMERTNRKSHLQPLSPHGRPSSFQNFRIDGSSPSASSSTTATQTPTTSDMDVCMQGLSIDPSRGSVASAGAAPGQSGFPQGRDKPFPLRTTSATNGVFGGPAKSGPVQGGGGIMQIPTRGNMGI
jgi:hypothetical protein